MNLLTVSFILVVLYSKKVIETIGRAVNGGRYGGGVNLLTVSFILVVLYSKNVLRKLVEL